MMLNNKRNSKSGKKKDKKKRFQRENKTGNQKREHIHWKPRNCNFIFSCCSIHETKAKKKEQWKKRQKQETKRKPKKEDKKEERKTRGKERQRKRNRKGGGQKRLREEERETLKINQKMPLLGGKQGFSIKAKKGKEPKRKKKATKKTNKKLINKEGLGPSEVALRATSPDP